MASNQKQAKLEARIQNLESQLVALRGCAVAVLEESGADDVPRAFRSPAINALIDQVLSGGRE